MGAAVIHASAATDATGLDSTAAPATTTTTRGRPEAGAEAGPAAGPEAGAEAGPEARG